MKYLRYSIPILLAFAMLLPTAIPANAQYPIDSLPSRGKVKKSKHDMVNLMEPIQNDISGPGWMMAQGMDNRLWIDRPGWNLMNRQSLAKGENTFSSSIRESPTLQSVGPGVLVPFRDPAPAFSRDLLITRDFSNRPLQTEPDLAVNPNDPDHLVLGVIDYNFPNNSAYVSIDGGTTWEGPQQVKYLRNDRVSGGDPVVTFDSKGNAYMASLSIGTKEYSIGSAVGFAMVSSIAIASSNDGGFTWNEGVSAARSDVASDLELDMTGRPRGEVQLSFLDKPWMTTGPHPTIEDLEVIYITYVEFNTIYDILYIGEVPTLGLPRVETTPRIVRSEDGGVTWSDPVPIGPTVQRTYGDIGIDDAGGSDAIGTKRVVQGPSPVVDSKGNLYTVWLDSTDDKSMEGVGEFYMSKSDDAGETFSAPKRIASFLEPGFRPRNAFFRYWASAFPKFAIGPNDELYVVYGALPPDNPSDEGDIFIIRSTNGGDRWSRPKRLNTDETDAPQFFPAVDVGPDGKIHVMWGDMRDDPVQTRYHIYYTSSDDQGDTWGFTHEELGLDVGDTRVTDFSSNPNKGFPSGLFLGDYFAIAATETDAYMVWADTRLGEFGPTNQKIGFSRLRAIPQPEIFISPPSGSGGETITVQGHGFQPKMDIFLRVGGNTISAGRTNSNGRFTTEVFVPISGEGAHQVQLVDESGNFATTSFYMEFGFDTIKNSLSTLEERIDANSSDDETAFNDDSAAFQQITTLQAELSQLKNTLQEIEPAAAQPALIAASGMGSAPMPWGMAGLAGLVFGAVLTSVWTLQRRSRKDGEDDE